MRHVYSYTYWNTEKENIECKIIFTDFLCYERFRENYHNRGKYKIEIGEKKKIWKHHKTIISCCCSPYPPTSYLVKYSDHQSKNKCEEHTPLGIPNYDPLFSLFEASYGKEIKK